MFISRTQPQLPQLPQLQRGSALIIAVFILVVMGFLAAGLTKTISASTDQVVNEVLGTRALLAAEAGNEMVLAQLFEVNASLTAGDLDALCTSTSGSSTTHRRYFSDDDGVLNASDVVGLLSCAVQSSCARRTYGGVDFFSVSSTGVCKSRLSGNQASPALGDFSCTAEQVCVSRTLVVEAKQ